MWLILTWHTILQDFFLLDSFQYQEVVMAILKSDWSNLKILIAGLYRKLTSSYVSFHVSSDIFTISQCPLGSVAYITLSVTKIVLKVFFVNIVQRRIQSPVRLLKWSF